VIGILFILFLYQMISNNLINNLQRISSELDETVENTFII